MADFETDRQNQPDFMYPIHGFVPDYALDPRLAPPPSYSLNPFQELETTNFDQAASAAQQFALSDQYASYISPGPRNSIGGYGNTFESTNSFSQLSHTESTDYGQYYDASSFMGTEAGLSMVHEPEVLQQVVLGSQPYFPSYHPTLNSAFTPGHVVHFDQTDTSLHSQVYPQLPTSSQRIGMVEGHHGSGHPSQMSPTRAPCDYPMCSSQFTYNPRDSNDVNRYKKHVRRTHDQRSPYPCPKDGCTMAITRIDNFKAHWASARSCGGYDATMLRTKEKREELENLHDVLLFRLRRLKRRGLSAVQFGSLEGLSGNTVFTGYSLRQAATF